MSANAVRMMYGVLTREVYNYMYMGMDRYRNIASCVEAVKISKEYLALSDNVDG